MGQTRKAKAAAGPKNEPGSRATKQTTSKAKAPQTNAADGVDADVFAGGGKKRRLDRRDTDGQAERVIADKFKGYDPIVISNRRNAHGETLAEVVAAEIKRKRPSGEYFKLKFWAKQHAEFQLDLGLFKDMPGIKGDSEPNDGLVEALAQSQEKSNGLRSIDRLESVLAHCPPLTHDDIVILISESKQTPIVTHDQSRAMYMLVLKHIGSHELFVTEKALWDTIKTEMESLAVEHATFLAVKRGMARKNIVKGMKTHLKPFLSLDTVQRIETALEEDREPLLADVQEVASTHIGLQIYKTQIGSMQYAMFVQRCEDRLKALEHNDFIPEEVAGASLQAGVRTGNKLM